MLKSQYISLILLLIVLVTLVNLYYKPHLTDTERPWHWMKGVTHPISKTTCALQGFKCPSDEVCDCEQFCNNGKEFVPFRVLDATERIYVMNERLSPGTYCLPKGIGKCNLKTSYHFYSMAGWSCININEDIFKQNKQKACQNEEAKDNALNVLYDFVKNEPVVGSVENYYERLPNDPNKLRYGCKCDSEALDGTRMISIFPFVCSVDYCLRDISNPLPLMGWHRNACVCGPYFHLDPDDKTSPCRREVSRIEKNHLIGRVDCMTKDSFVKQPLICPTDDGIVYFKEEIMVGGEPEKFIDMLMTNHYI